MANTKSAKRRIRVNERKRQRNILYRSRAKTAIKKVEQSIFSGEMDDAALREAVRTLDKAANKGILHKNNVARRKSRLMKKFNLAQQPATESAVS